MVVRTIVMTIFGLLLAGALFLPAICHTGIASCAEGTPASQCGGGTTTCENLVGMPVPEQRGEGALAVGGLAGALLGVAWGTANRRRRAREANNASAVA